MKNIIQILITVLVAAVVGYGAAQYAQPKNETEKTGASESVYARVMRTNTLRCGYGLAEPYISKDANTGQLSGMFYDYVEQMGKDLSLKIEWVEQTGWDTMPAALQADRFDVFCTMVWPTAARARAVSTTVPIFYTRMVAVVRADDTRFDETLDSANSPDIIIASHEGAIENKFAIKRFPDAKQNAVPGTIDYSQIFLETEGHKADITVSEMGAYLTYNKSNPGKLKLAMGGKPIKVFGTSMAIKQGEYQLKELLDTATTEMLWGGEIQALLEKYLGDTAGGPYMNVAIPYEEAK